MAMRCFKAVISLRHQGAEGLSLPNLRKLAQPP